MKYAIFAAFCAFAVPLMVWAASTSARMRGWLMSALIFSTCLGTRSSIHFTTIEGYRGTEDGLIVYLTDVICLSLALTLLLRFPQRLRWFHFNTGWLLALFAVACVSAMSAPNPALACYALFTFAKAYAIYWCVSNLLTIGTPPIYLWYGFMGIAGLVTAVTLKQRLVDHMPRVSGLFPHSNTLPSYAFLFLFVLLLWALCGPGLSKTRRWMTLCACGGLSIGIVLTMSRAGIVLLGVLLLATLWLAMKRAPSAGTRRTCAWLLGAMIICGAILAVPVLHRFATAPEASGEARHEFNHAALEMADDYTLGVGPNNYSYALSTMSEYRRKLNVLANESEAGVCHNIYLLTAAELGWTGLFVMCVTLLRFVMQAWWGATRSKNFEGLALYGMCIGWFGVLANGGLEWVIRQPFVMDMYAIVAAFSVCAVEAVRAQARARRPHNACRNRPRAAALAVARFSH